jgi:uncharacterized membrane protein
MSKIFVLLAIVLILSGALVLAAPFLEPEVASRSLAPEPNTARSLFEYVRNAAEAVQAPLSILFGVVSLYWNRRTYLKQTGD